MAFEKMTAEELRYIFEANFPDWSDGVVEYQKIGARVLKLICKGNQVLYFMWYDDTNWTLGTKLYRKKPKKLQAKINSLRNELATLDAKQKATMDVARGFENAVDGITDYRM